MNRSLKNTNRGSESKCQGGPFCNKRLLAILPLDRCHFWRLPNLVYFQWRNNIFPLEQKYYISNGKHTISNWSILCPLEISKKRIDICMEHPHQKPCWKRRRDMGRASVGSSWATDFDGNVNGYLTNYTSIVYIANIIYIYIYYTGIILVGGFNHSEKYESQLGWLFPIYGKIKKCSKPQTSKNKLYIYIYCKFIIDTWLYVCACEFMWKFMMAILNEIQYLSVHYVQIWWGYFNEAVEWGYQSK